MERAKLRIVAVCLTALLTAGNAYSTDSITLGTGTQGGGFTLYGAEFAKGINAGDASLIVRALNTKGSSENVRLLEAGKLDIALVQGEAAYEAFTGKGRPLANLKIIAAIYSTPGMFVVRGDGPYQTINDLKGKRVAFGAQGSGLVILARYVLDGIGLDPQKDFQSVYLDHAGDGPDMVASGSVSALWGGGTGWPGFTTISKARGGARFIAPDAYEISRILKKYPFLKQMTIPAGSYPGQSCAIASVGSWSFILTRPTLPDDIAYRIVRAMHRDETRICNALPQTCGTSLANTMSASLSIDLIHPGVMKYLAELSDPSFPK